MQRPIIWGPGKARAVQEFAAANGVDLAKSYFYADGDEDVALMYLVGNPRPTNPGGQAGRRRGQARVGRSCGSAAAAAANPVSQLRTAAGRRVDGADRRRGAVGSGC